MIDGDKTRGGIQELKEWKAPFEYLQSFENTANGGIPKIPARYAHPLGRIIAEPSLNPVNLVRNGTWITWTAVGVIGLCMCLVLAFILFVRKKLTSKKG